jgi:hypothetical protein
MQKNIALAYIVIKISVTQINVKAFFLLSDFVCEK